MRKGRSSTAYGGGKMADSRILIDNLSQLQQLDALPAAQTAG